MIQIARALHRSSDVLNHDFCPWANRWVYWMKHPLAALGAAGIVALACGIWVNPYALVLLGIVLLVGGLGTVWPWVAVRGLSAQAQFLTTRGRVGQAVIVGLKIQNRYPWPVWGLSLRRGFFDVGEESSGIALARVGGWSETEFEWAFHPPHRGVYPTQSPAVDTGFPFGMLHTSKPVEMANELIVWPTSVALDAMPDAVEIHSREDRLTDRRTGDCGDMVGTRPFRDGDSLRRVHWLQTARHGRLIVTERQAPAMCAVRLLVDVDADSHVIDADHSSLEQALSLAASIIEALHRQHAFVEVKVGEQRLTVGASEADLRRALDALARVPASGMQVEHGHCELDRPSRMLSTMAVTTDRALARHRLHRHVSGGERYLVIRTRTEGDAPPPTTDCNCHAWLELGVDEPLRDVLPARWRRACHA